MSHASQNGNLMSFIITVCSVVATTGVIKYFVPFLKQYEELGFSRKIKRFLLKMPDSKLNNIVNEKMVFEEFSDIEFCITNSGGDLIKEIELEAVEKNNLKNYKISEDMLNTKKAYFNISFFQFLFLLRIFFGNSFKKDIEDIQQIKKFIIAKCNDDDLKNIFYQLTHKDPRKIIPDKTYNVIKNDDNKRINQDFFDLAIYPFIYIERAKFNPALSTCLQINIGNLQRKFFPYWFMDMELIKESNPFHSCQPKDFCDPLSTEDKKKEWLDKWHNNYCKTNKFSFDGVKFSQYKRFNYDKKKQWYLYPENIYNNSSKETYFTPIRQSIFQIKLYNFYENIIYKINAWCKRSTKLSPHKHDVIEDYTFNSTKDMNMLIKDINSISFETKKELFIIYSDYFNRKNKYYIATKKLKRKYKKKNTNLA